MLSHDQLIFAIMKRYPDLIHSQDFWVAHPVATGSAKQIGEAQIMIWPEGVAQPDRRSLLDTFHLYADEFHTQSVREARNGRLAASDWTQLLDCPVATRNAWAPYRQALRDLPKQVGFPNQIIWPQPPTDPKLHTD